MFGLARTLQRSLAQRPDSVTVNGRKLPLAIRENARATRMTLRIEPGGRALKLTIPRGLAAQEIDAFLTRHHGWLMTRLAGVSDSGPLIEIGKIVIRGIEHRIEMTGKLRGLAEETEIDGVPTLMVSGNPEHTGTPRCRSPQTGRQARIGASGRQTCRDTGQAGALDFLQGHQEPLGVVYLGRQSVVFLADRDGAGFRYRLSRGP
jgi:hypothetical protein